MRTPLMETVSSSPIGRLGTQTVILGINVFNLLDSLLLDAYPKQLSVAFRVGGEAILPRVHTGRWQMAVRVWKPGPYCSPLVSCPLLSSLIPPNLVVKR